MKYRLALWMFMLLGIGAHAQIQLNGTVVDSLGGFSLNAVSIENLSTHDGTVTNGKGEFSLSVNVGDYILFTHVGYNKKVIRVQLMKETNQLIIMLSPKSTQLKPVTIRRGLSRYQKDSLNRAEIYQDVMQYQQQKSVFSPVTSIYQKFSKKHKNIRKFQKQMQDIEQQKFIDTRYSPEKVQSLTRLSGDTLAQFMNQYPMAYDYARAATELEINMWIKYNYQDYQRKQQVMQKLPVSNDTMRKEDSRSSIESK